MSCTFDEGRPCRLRASGISPRPLDCVACTIWALAEGVRALAESGASRATFEHRTSDAGSRGARH